MNTRTRRGSMNVRSRQGDECEDEAEHELKNKAGSMRVWQKDVRSARYVSVA